MVSLLDRATDGREREGVRVRWRSIVVEQPLWILDSESSTLTSILRCGYLSASVNTNDWTSWSVWEVGVSARSSQATSSLYNLALQYKQICLQTLRREMNNTSAPVRTMTVAKALGLLPGFWCAPIHEYWLVPYNICMFLVPMMTGVDIEAPLILCFTTSSMRNLLQPQDFCHRMEHLIGSDAVGHSSAYDHRKATAMRALP